MAKTVPSKGSIWLDDLQVIVEALEQVALKANEVGELGSCVIVLVFGETKVTCTYDKSDRDWIVRAT